MKLYFEYNYLESNFPIYTDQQKVFGEVELYEFESFVTLFEHSTDWTYRGALLMHEKGKNFTLIMDNWELFNRDGDIVGNLKEKKLSLHRRYDYIAGDGRQYSFICRLFSKNYTVIDTNGAKLASVFIKYGTMKNKVTLICHSAGINLQELITALTGVFILDRRRDQ